MVKLLQEPGPCSLLGHRQECISSASQFCFLCGFVMIMIAMGYILFYFLVCEQLKEAEETETPTQRVAQKRMAYRAQKVERSSPFSTSLSSQHLESKGAFQPFHPEKWNLRNESHAAQLTLGWSPNSRDLLGCAQVLPANLRSCCFRS